MQTVIDGEYMVTTLDNGTVIRELNRPAPAAEAPSESDYVTRTKLKAKYAERRGNDALAMQIRSRLSKKENQNGSN